MAWETTRDVERYAERAGPFLRAHPVQNTVPLTVTEGLRARGADPAAADAPLLGWWEDAGAVTGAFLWTPPRPPLLTAMPAEAAATLAELIAGSGRSLGGVNAPGAAAEAFAAAWQASTGAKSRPQRGMRLHRLDALVPPDPPPAGRAVLGAAADRSLLVAWCEAFMREVGEPTAGAEDQVDDRLGHGGLTLWRVDAEPVSLAGITRQVAGVTRVAPVYTPPEHRGRGYGAAATAAVTRKALDAGAGEVVLYTDLANPTTNRLYARLGYAPVEDRVVLVFDA